MVHLTVNTENVTTEMCHEKETTMTQIKKAVVAGYPALGHRAEKTKPYMCLSIKRSVGV